MKKGRVGLRVEHKYGGFHGFKRTGVIKRLVGQHYAMVRLERKEGRYRNAHFYFRFPLIDLTESRD